MSVAGAIFEWEKLPLSNGFLKKGLWGSSLFERYLSPMKPAGSWICNHGLCVCVVVGRRGGGVDDVLRQHPAYFIYKAQTLEETGSFSARQYI